MHSPPKWTDRPRWSDVTDASLVALTKMLGAMVAILFILQIVIGLFIFQSLETLRSIDNNLEDHITEPAEVIILED